MLGEILDEIYGDLAELERLEGPEANRVARDPDHYLNWMGSVGPRFIEESLGYARQPLVRRVYSDATFVRGRLSLDEKFSSYSQAAQ